MRNTRTHATKLKFASASVALACAASLAVAPIAGAADDEDAITPGWSWEDVSDNGLSIGDAAAYYENFRGTGADVWGWADDAFDTLFDAYLWWDWAQKQQRRASGEAGAAFASVPGCAAR